MQLTKVKILALAALVGACTTSYPSYVARFISAPTLSGGSFTSGGGITVATELQEQGGKTAVCGVWAESRRQSVMTKNQAAGLLPASSVYLGKERLVQNLSFLRKVRPMADYSGQEVNCVLTNRVWRAGDQNQKPIVRIPRRVIERDLEDLSGIVIYFFQTGPGAGE